MSRASGVLRIGDQEAIMGAVTTTYREASRQLGGMLAPAEKRALVWMATRMPAWVTSDQLTALGFVALVACGGGYALARLHPAWLGAVIVCLAVNWFGDSLDGTLARVRGQQRPRYGYYVDHVLDAAGTACLLGGLAVSGFMTPVVALGVLVAYFLVNIESYLAAHSCATFQVGVWGIGPTELRILIAIGNLRLLVNPWVTVSGRQWLLFDVGAVVAGAGMIAAFVASAVANGRRLYAAEPLPDRARS